MDKNIIKSVISSLHKQIRETSLIERPMKFEQNVSYVLVGIRRAGKSYLMIQDIKQRIARSEIQLEDCLYINFEDERLDGLSASELQLLIDCYQEMFGPQKPLVYLDEIQNITGWEKFVRRLADQKYRVMVTGSNARMLSKEVATTLGGRYIIREIYPFSYSEYLTYHGITLQKNWEYNPDIKLEVIRRFDDYFYNGGFAEMFPLVNKREWINSLYQKILLGDIIARHAIRGDRSIRLLARKVAENVMQPTSLSRFIHIIKSSGESISMPTLKDYLQYMEDNYLSFSLLNYVSPISEQETIKKRYYMDNGLLNNFLFRGETKLLENLCAIHLLKKYSNADEPQLFFYNRNIEVDFYIPDEKLAIQASFDMSETETWEREISALVALHKVFPLQRAQIVTRDTELQTEHAGLSIEVIPIWKWLLDT
ncbi:MAG: ATP-binding protein [Bacteroidaceae bacterium]|nr:ATP-binding protein [Bacteroidaceae bacterium]